MNIGAAIVLLLIAWVGYVLVSFVFERFRGTQRPSGGSIAELDAVYAKALGVPVGATMAEAEQALQRALELYAPENVRHMSPEDQRTADIRLRQANRAFLYISQRLRGIETPELPPV